MLNLVYVLSFLLGHLLSLLCQRYAMDAAFYMAKELLMTERTYQKDLQVIAVVSKDLGGFSVNSINCIVNSTE